jgi:hypothetical protein
MQSLAATMMHGHTFVDLRLTIDRTEAERELGGIFAREKYPIRDILDDLLKYHLIQKSSLSGLEFHHQLIQEYWAAEDLLLKLPDLSDEQLKGDYLNYLKWTESLKMLVSLLNTDRQVGRIMRLASEVDPFLEEKLRAVMSLEAEDRYRQRQHEQPLNNDSALSDIFDLEAMLHRAIGELRSLPDSANVAEDVEGGTDRVIQNIDEQLAEVSETYMKRSDELTAFNAVGEKLRGLGGSDISRILVGLIEKGCPLAKEYAALLLSGQARTYYGDGLQDDFIRSSVNLTRYALVCWLVLLTHRNASVRAYAITVSGKIPLESAVPALIRMLLDREMCHFYGEDRGGEYVCDVAAKALRDIIEKGEIDAWVPYMSYAKQLWFDPSAAKVWSRFGRREIVIGVIAAMQARCRYYDYDVYQTRVTASGGTR